MSSYMQWETRDGEQFTVAYGEPLQSIEAVGESWYESESAFERLQDSLPDNWDELYWYKAEQYPCLWGYDIFLAVDTTKMLGFVIVDGHCHTRHLRDIPKKYIKKGCGSVDDFIRWQCEYTSGEYL